MERKFFVYEYACCRDLQLHIFLLDYQYEQNKMKLSLNIGITWYDYISKKIRLLDILLQLIFSKSNDVEYVI